ncbi:hypothetical protein JCM10207_001799 [Rhodosporidiobolus poonsookiae]
MSLDRLLGPSSPHPQRTKQPYAPTRRISPATSLLTPISRVELAQCQTSVNPLRTRPPLPGTGGAPPAAAGLPAQPQGPLPPPPQQVGQRKRPNQDTGGALMTHKRPRANGDTRTVADHYNARPNTDRESRLDSPIIGLKSFNNWIKTVLIAKFGRHESEREKPLIRVLDLGCGKGGDLQKWGKAGTSEYIGIDLAAVSIEQARSRHAGLRGKAFHASFFALDCFESSIEEVLDPSYFDPQPFDIVSMQFCMHYALETEAKARQMLENVARFLRPGGVFIGTIPDANNLFAHLDASAEAAASDPSLNPLVFGNSVYSVKFDSRDPPSSASPYGHRYTFFLQDAVEEVPEYVVYWDAFVELAAQYGLTPTYVADFQTIFADEQDDAHFRQLLRRMKVMDEEGNAEMDEDQLDAAMLYMGFAFVKDG